MECQACGAIREGRRNFCECGRVWNIDELRAVRIMGFVGVRHTTSERVDAFLSTGEPSHLIDSRRGVS